MHERIKCICLCVIPQIRGDAVRYVPLKDPYKAKESCVKEEEENGRLIMQK
jgi:hypothetical protein